MTHPELQELFKTELAHLMEKGLSKPFVRPMLTNEGEHFPGMDMKNPQPSTHELYCERPFIFDIRKIPDTFHGFTLSVFINWSDKPEEFKGPKQEEEDEEEVEDEEDDEEDGEDRDEEESKEDGEGRKKKKRYFILYPIDVILPPEKVIAYAEEHALDICEQLGDYTFTLKNICDMIVGRDFEEHKKECEEIRLRRLLS